jgi:lysine 6-dehydrogenase
MGRVVVKCLLSQDRSTLITVADRAAPSSKLPSRVRFAKVNLLKHAALVKVLRKHDVVINSTSHHFNLPVMRAALAANVHYLDLGGLFHFTRRQLKLHSLFEKKGLTAILGMGCAPGVANLLAKWASEGMNTVDEVHIKVGGRAWGVPSDAIPYAIGTIREELTLRPAIVQRGKWHFANPRSGVEQFNFPPPVGRQKIFRTLHSEVATLPVNLPGVREASFKIGFSDEVIRAVLKPARKRKSFPPPKPPQPTAPLRDAEITAALVKGRINRKKVCRVASYVSFSSGKHCAGDWNTAWPPAIVARMIAQKQICQKGVFAPETVVPYQDVFKKLKQVGFKVFCQKRS